MEQGALSFSAIEAMADAHAQRHAADLDPHRSAEATRREIHGPPFRGPSLRGAIGVVCRARKSSDYAVFGRWPVQPSRDASYFYCMQDPRTKYPKPPFPEQTQA